MQRLVKIKAITEWHHESSMPYQSYAENRDLYFDQKYPFSVDL